MTPQEILADAIRNYDPEKMKKAIKAGADPNGRIPSSYSESFNTIHLWMSEMMPVDSDIINKKTDRPTLSRWEEMIKVLVEAGFDVNLPLNPGYDGGTMFIGALETLGARKAHSSNYKDHDYTKAIEILLRYGADPITRCPSKLSHFYQWTPMEIAKHRENEYVIKLLEEKISMSTPQYMMAAAIKSRDAKKMKEAIKAGTDPNGLYSTPTNDELFTLQYQMAELMPYDDDRLNRKSGLPTPRLWEEMLKVLVEAGFDVNLPLHKDLGTGGMLTGALESLGANESKGYDHTKAIEILLRYGADPTAPCRPDSSLCGWTPLEIAKERENEYVIKLLEEKIAG